MKKFRKSFFATLAFIMTLSALQTNIYALNHVLGDGEDPYVITFKSPGERIAEIKTAVTYNDTQKNLAIEKILKKEQEKNSNNSARVRNTTASDYSYTLSVPYEGQWYYYYCSPATTRQTLRFFNVSNVPAQNQIASALGVTEYDGLPDATVMINYINSYIPNEAPYAEEHPTDVEDMILSFKIACRDYGPPIIRMMSSSYSDWPYSTDYIGHYLNVSGAYRTNGSYTFELTDPYIGYVSSSTTGKYTKSAQAVYDVIMEHWFHGYWW